MPIKVQHGGGWQDITTGEFRIRNPTVATDWIYAANVKICMNDGPGGTNRWIDSGYLGVPNAPGSMANAGWSYTSMTVSWTAPVANGIPVSGYRTTVVEQSGPTRTFDTTALSQAFSVENDTKYTVSVQALGDTGVPGLASNALKPWIGHPKVSTFTTTTQWRDWQSDTKYFSKGPPDTGIYRNEIEGIYIHTGYKATHLHVNLSGKYPWVPEDGYIINNSDRTAEYIVAGAPLIPIAPRHVTVWTETIPRIQTTVGAYGIRLTGSGWSTAGGTKGLTGSMYAIGLEAYQVTTENVTVTEKTNTYW